MKKVSGLIAVAAILIALTVTSCKKDYNCECTYTSTNGTKTVTPHTLSNSKKSDAKAACAAIQTDNAGDVCTLK